LASVGNSANCIEKSSVGDLDPEHDPDPEDPHVFGPPGLVEGTDTGIRIRTKISRIRNTGKRVNMLQYLDAIFF
jgi:hypothetical protein